MGSSLVLTGGAATTKTLKESISLSGHGFSVGTVLRYNPSGTPQLYVPAQADSAENAEVLGIVNAVTDANTFELTYGGYLEMPAFSGISFPVMFLSGVCAGGLTSNPPSALGQVIKPVATKHPTLNGFVLNNYLGTQIGGSSTVGIDQVQPVGSIMPFAGSAIPDSWLECNGTTYSVSEYPELYGAIQYTTGARAPLYGYVAVLTGTNVSSVLAVGDYIQYKAGTGAWTGTGSPLTTSNADLLAQVISVTSTTAVVQVLPIYSLTNKNFTVNNAVFGGGGFVGSENGTGNYRAYTSTSAFKSVSLTITAIAITHFNTPDMRGRFALGINTSALGEIEADTANISAISGIYSLGSEGGEERHTLTANEMASHSHDYTTNPSNATNSGTQGGAFNRLIAADGNYTLSATGYQAYETPSNQPNLNDSGVLTIGATGGNTPHNNMPPYLAVRYIIKAKPYTRAAIIDGLDLPWQSTLVRDLRTRAIGGSNSDLVFYTNTAGDSGLGTERMRLTSGGTLGIGTSTPSDSFSVDIVNAGQSGIRINGNGGTYRAIFGANSNNPWIGSETNHDFRFLTNSTEKMRLTAGGSLGIGTQTPAVALDVVGNIKASIGLVLGGATFAAPSGTAPLFGVRAWVRFGVNDDASVTIQGSGNIAAVNGVVRNASGDFTINFNTPLPASYAVCGAANEGLINSGYKPSNPGPNNYGLYCSAVSIYSQAAATTTSCRILIANIDGSGSAPPVLTDAEICTVMFVG